MVIPIRELQILITTNYEGGGKKGGMVFGGLCWWHDQVKVADGCGRSPTD
jgi:hypothetical protein